MLGKADTEAHALPALLLRNLGRMVDAGVVGPTPYRESYLLITYWSESTLSS